MLSVHLPEPPANSAGMVATSTIATTFVHLRVHSMGESPPVTEPPGSRRRRLLCCSLCEGGVSEEGKGPRGPSWRLPGWFVVTFTGASPCLVPSRLNLRGGRVKVLTAGVKQCLDCQRPVNNDPARPAARAFAVYCDR